MSTELYEVVSMAARYWFIGIALVFVFRAWRGSISDNRKAKLLRDMTARAGCIGELIVVRDDTGELTDARFPVSRECMLGASRYADIRIDRPGIFKRHLWMEQRVGCLALSPIGAAKIRVGGRDAAAHILRDGQRVTIGGITLMLVFFDAEGFAGLPAPHRVQPQPVDENGWRGDEPANGIDADCGDAADYNGAFDYGDAYDPNERGEPDPYDEGDEDDYEEFPWQNDR